MTIPNMVKTHQTGLEQARKDFKEILNQQMEAFNRELSREREVHGEHIERIVKTLEDRVPSMEQILDVIKKSRDLRVRDGATMAFDRQHHGAARRFRFVPFTPQAAPE